VIDTVVCLFYIALAVVGVVGGAISIANQPESSPIDPVNVLRDAMGRAVIARAPFVGVMAVPEVAAVSGDTIYSAGEALNSVNIVPGIAKNLLNIGTKTYASSIAMNSFLNGANSSFSFVPNPNDRLGGPEHQEDTA
jgi:hypothetical protein